MPIRFIRCHATPLEFPDSVLDRGLKRILIPLLDDWAPLIERGRDLFGVEIRTAEDTRLRGQHLLDPGKAIPKAR